MSESAVGFSHIHTKELRIVAITRARRRIEFLQCKENKENQLLAEGNRIAKDDLNLKKAVKEIADLRKEIGELESKDHASDESLTAC